MNDGADYRVEEAVFAGTVSCDLWKVRDTEVEGVEAESAVLHFPTSAIGCLLVLGCSSHQSHLSLPGFRSEEDQRLQGSWRSNGKTPVPPEPCELHHFRSH